MDGVRFNGVYRLIPQFSHPYLAPDDPVTDITKLLNRWVDNQNQGLVKEQDQFTRFDKALGRKINPIEGRAIEALTPTNLNRCVLWVTNDRLGNDLTEYQSRIAPFANYSKQSHNYDYSDVREMGLVHQDFAARAINQGVFFKKAWFQNGSRLEASVEKQEATTAKPNVLPSQVVFRQPNGWERFWMYWRQP